MALNLEDIFVVFNHGGPLEQVSLRGLNLEVKSNDKITVIGNNSSGKSTLLRMLAGHIYPSFGKIIMNGADITHQNISDRAKIFSGVFFDYDISCYDNLLVIENLALAMMDNFSSDFFKPAITDEMKSIIETYTEKYDFIGLKNVLYDHTYTIPRAQRQALSLLMATMRPSKILLIDEFVKTINQELANRLLNTMKKIVEDKGLSIIAVMHNPKIDFEFFNRCILIANGKVALDITGEAKKQLDFTKIDLLRNGYNNI